MLVRYFQLNAFEDAKFKSVLATLKKNIAGVTGLVTEKCYHIELEPNTSSSSLSEDDEKILRWILKNPQQQEDTLTSESSFSAIRDDQLLIEVGPRFNFSTADSTNSVSICHSAHLTHVKRVEVSVRYLISVSSLPVDDDVAAMTQLRQRILSVISDRMTQCEYTKQNIPKDSFDENLPKSTNSWFFVPILKDGRKALEKVNQELGLAFDNWDLDYYTNLFVNDLKRDPTSVELFDCAQSNSEHSRHWFFRGRMIVDGEEQEKSLIRMIIDTQEHTNVNNTIKFSDNSSAIRGYTHRTLVPSNFTQSGPVKVQEVTSDLIFTAETHNMPTAVAPFSGATTGTGGRIR